MFGGDDARLSRVMGLAFRSAWELGHPRVGSEHLLLALSLAGGCVGDVLARHGATPAALERAVRAVGPTGAGAAADRHLIAVLGVDLDRLPEALDASVWDRPPPREPRFPLGVHGARRRCARTSPPLGIDAQAA